MSSSSHNHDDLAHLKIPLKDILSATNNFAEENFWGEADFGNHYKGQLLWSGELIDIHSYRWNKEWDEKEQQFWIEISMLSALNHKNLVSLIGFCDENGEKIIIIKREAYGSLDNYLSDDRFTWVRRLEICVAVAQALSYIHYDESRDYSVIHQNLQSETLLINHDFEPKLSEFRHSMKIEASQRHASFLVDKVRDIEGYTDPTYLEAKRANHKSYIYSLGIVMFELLCGRKAVVKDDQDNKYLAPMAITHYRGDKLNEIIDWDLWQQMDSESLNTFAETAYDCLNEERSQRPNIDEIVPKLEKALKHACENKPMIMSSPSNEFAHLKVPLQNIISATNNFHEEKRISTSGLANEYKGQLLWSGELIDITARRFNRERDDREQLFLTEISMLSTLKHKNVVSLVGFCDENDEKIIIIRNVTRGMLCEYLSDPMLLTWVRRLKICVSIAHALSYIHYDEPHDFSIIHRMLCSNTIVLNDDWEPKLYFFDFSMKIKASQRHHSFHTNNLKYPISYGDPTYIETKSVNHKSDMYSFGVIMFELICGRASIIEDKDDNHLAPLASTHYKEKKLDNIIDKGLWKQMDLDSFNMFAYKCLDEEQSRRPNIDDIVPRLEKALELARENRPMSKCREDYSTIKKEELYSIFSKGILLQQDKVLLSFVGNGERNEMVSATIFSYVKSCPHELKSLPESSFGTVVKILDTSNLFIEIKTRAQFLSPNVVYGVYLVFKFCDSRNSLSKPMCVNLKYRKGHESLHAYFATSRDEQWMMIELHRFLSQKQDVVLEFLLESFASYYCGDAAIYVEGIQFRPIDKVKHVEIEKLKEVQQVLKPDFKVDQVQQLPTNFEEIFKECRNYEELYWLGEVDGKKLLVLSAKAALYKLSNVDAFTSKPPAQSRFQEVIEFMMKQVFHINCTIKSQMLSPDTEYMCNLLFQLSENCQGMHCPVKVRDVLHEENKEAEFLYFITPDSSNIHDITRVPKQREDGLMEIQLWKFNSAHEFKDDSLSMNMKFTCHEGTMSGLIVCGLEFRPM